MAHEMTASQTHNIGEVCEICSQVMNEYSPMNSLKLICCTNKWCHRACIRKIAFENGKDLVCPSCGDSDRFKEYLLSNGVYITGIANCDSPAA